MVDKNINMEKIKKETGAVEMQKGFNYYRNISNGVMKLISDTLMLIEKDYEHITDENPLKLIEEIWIDGIEVSASADPQSILNELEMLDKWPEYIIILMNDNSYYYLYPAPHQNKITNKTKNALYNIRAYFSDMDKPLGNIVGAADYSLNTVN